MDNLIKGTSGSIGVTLAETVVAGRPFVKGDLVLIPQSDGKSGDFVACYYDGVFGLSGGSSAFTIGTLLYWDATNNRVTATAGSNKKIGYAIAPAAATDDQVKVLLTQNNE